ncbi:MAG: ABC transporter permease, partial [Eubacteriales bacterium]|nr:ABC transporter permease [Eubacteriales bacterium]
MRFKDLFRLACQNLFRRKMRSFLTILGVVIGCTAIVSMMSLGYGLERNMLSSIQDSSELTTISLMGMEGMRDNTKVQLNDSEVEFLEALPGVRRVERIYTVFVRLISGKYETYQEIKCYDDQTLREMGYEIIEGHDLDFDSKASSTPSLLIGKNVLLGFQKPGAHRMYWGGGPDEPESKAPEDLNLLTKNCFIDVQESIFYSPDIQS